MKRLSGRLGIRRPTGKAPASTVPRITRIAPTGRPRASVHPVNFKPSWRSIAGGPVCCVWCPPPFPALRRCHRHPPCHPPYQPPPPCQPPPLDRVPCQLPPLDRARVLLLLLLSLLISIPRKQAGLFQESYLRAPFHPRKLFLAALQTNQLVVTPMKCV